MSAPIHLPGELTVCIPMRRYNVSPGHQALDAIGNTARFLLQALAHADVSVADIQRITALSDTQLTPLLERLNALQWYDMDAAVLTEKGASMAQIASLVSQPFPLWIDLLNKDTAPLLCRNEADLVTTVQATELELRSFEQDWNVQKVLQGQRLRSYPQQKAGHPALLALLSTIWPEHQSLFRYQQQATLHPDWYCTLQVDPNAEMAWWPVRLDATTPVNGKGQHLTLKCPTLSLCSRFSIASDLADQVVVPPDHTLQLCRVSGQPLAPPVAPSEASHRGASWPDDLLCPQADLLAMAEAHLPVCSPLINRTLEIETGHRTVQVALAEIRAAAHRSNPAPWNLMP